MLRESGTVMSVPLHDGSRRAGVLEPLRAASILALVVAVTVASAKAEGLSDRHRDGFAEPVLYDWTGLYVGGHAIPAFTAETDGVIAGAHLGFNHVLSRRVVGLEVSLSDGDLDGRQAAALPQSFLQEPNVTIADATLTHRFDIDQLFLATARLGYTWDGWLIYLKGGYASATIKTSQIASGTAIVELQYGQFLFPFEAEGRTSERHHGWTIGAGLEYALTTNIILGLEYNFIDLEGQTHRGLAAVELDGEPLAPVRVSANIDPEGAHTVWARLSFKFGGDSALRHP